MRIAILSCGSVVVREKEQEWLFGAPAGASEALKEAGFSTPRFLFLTALRAPDRYKLNAAVFKEEPLSCDNLSAMPIRRKHGVDYHIKTDGADILFSERGDVGVADVQGFDLAIIRNKHRADGFGPNVITWPWPDTEYDIDNHELLHMDLALKVWKSPKDVPDNLKKIDDVELSLAQSNWIARVAEGAGKGGDENWAIAISQFKKLHHKGENVWIENEKREKEENPTVEDVICEEVQKEEKYLSPETVEKLNEIAEEIAEKEWTPDGPVERLGDKLVSRIHSEFTEQCDYLYGQGYMNEQERILLSNAIGDALKTFRNTSVDNGMSSVLERPINIPSATPPEMKPIEMQTIVFPEAFKELIPDAPEQIESPVWSTVYKDMDGKDRWATITAVAMWDRQKEMFPPEAMDWAIRFASVVGPGPLRYKHFPGLDGGDCDRQVRAGDFLFESGTFRDDPIGLAMKSLLETDPGWRISPGLLFGREDLVDGVYKRAWIFERSLTKVPAIPATATVSVVGGVQMKQLTEQELLQAAKELNLDPKYLQDLHQKAIAGLGGAEFGMKEFTGIVMKDMKSKALKMAKAEDEEEIEDDEDEEDDEMEEDESLKLKSIVDSLDDEQRGELVELLGATLKEDDPVADLRQNLYDLTCIVEKMAEERNSGGLSALKEWAEGTPRRQAAKFAVRKEKSSEPVTTDEQILETLNRMEQQLKEQKNPALGDLYNLFTSQQLNAGRQ